MTHTVTPPLNLSFLRHSLLPTILFSLLFLPFVFSPCLCLAVRQPLPLSTRRLIRPPAACAGLGLRREGRGGWAFLLFLRWRRHRGAIDSSTGPHSLLMLECVISWQFSHTEIDCAEFLKCTAHCSWAWVVSASFWKDKTKRREDSQPTWPPWPRRCSRIICVEAEDGLGPAAAFKAMGAGWADSRHYVCANTPTECWRKVLQVSPHAKIFGSGLNQTSELM